MNKTLFFDVETNNLRNDRICQLAVIYEEDGKEVFADSWYINPQSPFSKMTIDVHGITEEMVKDAPIFPDVFQKIRPLFETSLVVGHNTRFDLNVLDKVLQYYDIHMDAVSYADTMTLASWIPGRPDSRKLNELCGYYGISLNQHHDAMCDTRACCDLYHLAEKYIPDISSQEETYWFGTARLKADENELGKALFDLDGILFGISSDGNVDSSELQAIRRWREDHEHQIKYEEFKEVFLIIDHILKTESIDEWAPLMIHKMACEHKGKKYADTTIALNTLKGMLNGILADSEIGEDEMISLRTWMHENESLRGNYPFDGIFEAIEKVMADGKITDDEGKNLKEIFQRFTDPLSATQKTTVPLEGKTVCLSGNFVNGSKAEIEKLITEMGGIPVNSVTKKTDVLVVGGEGNSQWAYGNYGSKVKKALQMQESGHPIVILGESEIFKK